MCLVAISIGRSERFPFVLASNRDEFFDRASQPLAWWQPRRGVAPVLSGKDLAGGGTWLGLNAAGRLALVTNVREPGRHLAVSPSRGELVLQCLADPQTDLTELASTPRNGFNLLRFDLCRVAADAGPDAHVGEWVSNRPAVQHRAIGAGAFGLSNASFDTPWPKVNRLKQRLSAAVDRSEALDALMAEALAALRDPQPAADAELPSTGVPLNRERQLSSAFIRIDGDPDNRNTDSSIHSGAYGTRCSTLVVVERLSGQPNVHVVEHTYDHTYDATGRHAGVRAEHFALPAPR